MNSTVDSDFIVKAQNIRVSFEVEYYKTQSLRDQLKSIFNKPEVIYVVDDISFEIKQGMRLGIMGVNSSGKTTLCRCLANMISPQHGKIHSNGEVKAIFNTGIGMMPELTGRENARLLARLFYPEIKNIDSIIDDAIELSELGQKADISFGQYSKGMQRQLILSLISARSTDLLILDEVLEGIDIFFQKKLALRIQNSSASIIVTQSAQQVRELCNNLMVVHKGKMTYLGEVDAGLDFFQRTNHT